MFSFQMAGGICLGKIIGLGLAYSLVSTFLSSGPALTLATDKNPAQGVLPWADLVGEVGLIGMRVDAGFSGPKVPTMELIHEMLERAKKEGWGYIGDPKTDY
ncbi:hypothetical protein [Janthinobacterium sp. MDT1-19]|uniref:hypothetical protein n=1 Tax=Janthinobacterium sp. MDT1-19 TaxID=1259339 RepID=UPI003F209BE9